MSAPDTALYRLTKSRLVSFRQCPKRMFLEIFRKDLISTTTVDDFAQ